MTLPLDHSFFNVLSLVLGLIAGSFLNVVIARVPEGKSVVRPPSACPSCHSRIRAYDNIPILSYLLLRGKCRQCAHPISIRYPVVELLTGLLFLAAKIRFGWSIWLICFDWPFLMMLVAITFIDLQHRIIPDVISLPGLGLGLLGALVMPGGDILTALGGAALGFGIFYFFAWSYERSTGRNGLGGGDIKLLAMLGAFVGPMGVITTILISSIIGSVVGIAIGLAKKEKNLRSVSIPFGPFLVIGALYVYLLGDLLWLPFSIPT